MEMDRPDPDKLLESMEMEEEKKKQGRLRIFFGYVAGVGKTYGMLKSARKRLPNNSAMRSARNTFLVVNANTIARSDGRILKNP